LGKCISQKEPFTQPITQPDPSPVALILGGSTVFIKCLWSYEGAPYYGCVKMFKRVRYRVTCEEPGAPQYTKEASSKLANQ
jgi:hypothetical protein